VNSAMPICTRLRPLRRVPGISSVLRKGTPLDSAPRCALRRSWWASKWMTPSFLPGPIASMTPREIWEGDRMIAAEHHRYNALGDKRPHCLGDALEGAFHVGQYDLHVPNISGAERSHGTSVAARIGREIHQALAHPRRVHGASRCARPRRRHRARRRWRNRDRACRPRSARLRPDARRHRLHRVDDEAGGEKVECGQGALLHVGCRPIKGMLGVQGEVKDAHATPEPISWIGRLLSHWAHDTVLYMKSDHVLLMNDQLPPAATSCLMEPQEAAGARLRSCASGSLQTGDANAPWAARVGSGRRWAERPVASPAKLARVRASRAWRTGYPDRWR